MNIISTLFIIYLLITCTKEANALPLWTLSMSYESRGLLKKPAVLFATADFDGNGAPEIVITDFGLFDENTGKRSVDDYNLYVFEWRDDKLNMNYHKKWAPSRRRYINKNFDTDMSKLKMQNTKALEYEVDSFDALHANQLTSWSIGQHVTVETMPPYFGLQWANGKYILHDEQVWEQHEKLNSIGSWALPWISPTCYPGFVAQKGPRRNVKEPLRECLVGLRDFTGEGSPQILSITQEEIGWRKYKQTLRLRNINTGFPIEWETISPDRFSRWSQGSPNFIDPLNWRASSELMMFGFESRAWFVLSRNKQDNTYKIMNTNIKTSMGIESLTMPYIYLRSTQDKHQSEYWGYRVETAKDKGDLWLLRKVEVGPEQTTFKQVDISFDHHEPFLGVEYFNLIDLDNDGIDEVILVERTGKRTFTEDRPLYSDVKEYIHILKWNGQMYQTMWVSPPYTKIGTKFIVDDIKKVGKKQLVVFTPHGTIQIWEQ